MRVLTGSVVYYWLVLLLSLSACQHRPVTELVLADVSLKSAQKSKADRFATDTYRKAENHYLRAKRDYSDGYFESAKKNAVESRMLAEKAEYESLLKQNQLKSGETEQGYNP